MHKLLPLVTAALLLSGCAAMPWSKSPPKPSPVLKVEGFCPSWQDATKAEKAKLAGEIDAAAADTIWPDIMVRDQGLKDQLVAAGCKPVG